MIKSILIGVAVNLVAVGPAFAHHGPEHTVSSSQTAFALGGLAVLMLMAVKIIGSASQGGRQRPRDIT